MTITVKDLKNMRRTTEVNYLGEKGNVTYAPGAITDEMMEKIKDARESEDESALDEFLSMVVISWDVVDDGRVLQVVSLEKDGSSVPHPDLKMLPIPFKSAVLLEVMDDATPKAKNDQRYVGGSRQKGR